VFFAKFFGNVIAALFLLVGACAIFFASA
jgi:hypothetical protein